MPRKAQTESASDLNAAPGGAAAVDRALSLLAAFQPGDEALSLGDFAARTQLYKSTVLRLLASLEHAALVRRLNDGRYALGAEIARLHSLYAAAFSLDQIVPPVLRELVAATGESAAYHVKQGHGPDAVRVCLYRIDSPHPIRDHIKAGDVLPLGRGTGGRVLTAFDTEANAPVGKDKALYAKIRKDGYFSSVGDRLADVAGISAPVHDAHGALAAAVTLTMPAHRYDPAYIGPVLAAAKQLNGRV
ncbi:IclR family transcriptional regulator [Variovorax sp. dw_954]|uniref:IclR family transcriptional regulator n=1 Tax=Variovorax sp. dw_954 TaxID=2720078 RepID=UPI001BD4F23D|nr:IclR family transcriptional regulator [Variovorax sp. dw_954]